MPYWTFGGFDAVGYPAEDVGLFYQLYEDKMIITWSYFENNFGGMGDPMSAQLFLYKNGTMKFQYKLESNTDGGDLTSQFTFIGLQKNSTEGIHDLSEGFASTTVRPKRWRMLFPLRRSM